MQIQCVRLLRTFSSKDIARQCMHNSALLSSWPTPIGSGVGAACLTEYQKPFHAHHLTQTMRRAKRSYLCSANQVAFIHALPTAHTDPSPRRLELDLPELTEAMIQSISQLEAAGRLDYLAIRLRRVTSTLKLLRGLSSLRSLDLSHTKMTDDYLSYLKGCRSLVKLDVSYCSGLMYYDSIASIKTLEVVKLSKDSRLVGVRYLGELPCLKTLELRHSFIDDEDVRQLSKSKTLVNIDLYCCPLLKNANLLSSIKTLEVINLSRCKSLTHVGALSNLPALRELNLSWTFIKDEDVRLLSDSNTLVKIDLSGCEKLRNVKPLSSIATLEVIDLSHCFFLSHLGALGKLPALREIHLRSNCITDEEIRQLSDNNTLVKIDICLARALTNVNPLSSIATLEEINLSGCDSLTHVGELSKLPALKEIDLSGTLITDEDVRQLSKSNTLVKIDLQSCDALTNVNPLSSIKTLEVIDLSRCESLTHLGALGKLPALKEVNLGYTRITDEDVRPLSESHTLVKINVHSCYWLTDVNALSSIATLEVLNLTDCCCLTHVGALGKFPVLKEVYLSRTPITDEDVRLLSESHTLVKIDLHWCEELTNVNPLSSIATLEVINLSKCTSLTHLGELGKLPVLKEINLRSTGITDDDVNCLTSLRQQLGLPSIGIIVDSDSDDFVNRDSDDC